MTADVRRIPAGVLLGGRSARMGSPKHELVDAEGRTLLARTLVTLYDVCAPVVTVGGPDGPRAHVEHVRDRHTDVGPLAGVDALCTRFTDGDIIIVACDMPGLTSHAIRRLIEAPDADAVRFDDARALMPLRLHTRCAVEVRSQLQANRHRVKDLLDRLRVRLLPMTDDLVPALENVNTPADARRWGLRPGA